MADVCPISLHKGFSQGIQAVEIVAGVRDPFRLEAQPSDHLFNRDKVLLLLALGVGVIESQVAISSMLLGEAEIDGDSLTMAYV